MKKGSIQSFSEALTICLFIGLLFLPLLGSFWSFDFYPYEGENRVPARFPDLGKTPVNELPDALSDYVNDHFGLRNTFIHGYNNFYTDVLQMKKGGVTVGLDDWLFFDDNTKNFMGFRRFSDEQVKQIVNSITLRYKWINEQKIPFLMVIPPNKINVYGDMLPDAVPAPDALSQWRQVEATLPPLMAENYNYMQIDNKIIPKNDDHIITENYPISETRSWHTWPKNASPSLRTNPEKTNRLLVFGDSFGYHLLTFLPQHFNQVAFSQMYASKANMEALIEEFMPDAILEVHLERMIERFTETKYYLDTSTEVSEVQMLTP